MDDGEGRQSINQRATMRDDGRCFLFCDFNDPVRWNDDVPAGDRILIRTRWRDMNADEFRAGG